MLTVFVKCWFAFSANVRSPLTPFTAGAVANADAFDAFNTNVTVCADSSAGPGLMFVTNALNVCGPVFVVPVATP